MTIIFLNLLLSLATWAENPHFHSLVVYDAKTLQPRGSVTQVLPYLNPDRLYYVTAAHVYENSNGLVTPNLAGLETLTLEMIDSSLDLAILSSPIKLVAIGALSTPFNQTLITYPKVYDIQATQGFPQYQLALEGYDPVTNQLRRTEFQGSIAETHSSGLPGREGAEKLWMVNGRALPGYSGGALVENVPSPIPGRDRPYLRGIVLAVDPFAEKMIVLPYKEIHEAFFRWRSLKNKASVRTEIKVPGGVKYLDSEAIHYRSGQGQFRDSGVGRTTDGTNLSIEGLFTSGITLPAFPHRRWLSIEDFWSEGEPYPRNKRALLKKTFNGVYEENGQLFATSPSTSLPLLFEQREKNCEMQNSSNGKKTINVFICSWKNERESVFALAIPQANSKWSVYRIRLEKTATAQMPLPIRITAEHWNHSGSSQHLQNSIENPTPQGSPMQRDGIRTFRINSTWLHIELSGGYQIRTGPQVLTGPVVFY